MTEDRKPREFWITHGEYKGSNEYREDDDDTFYSNVRSEPFKHSRLEVIKVREILPEDSRQKREDSENIPTRNVNYARAAELIRQWANDSSDYDSTTYPQIEALLNHNHNRCYELHDAILERDKYKALAEELARALEEIERIGCTGHGNTRECEVAYAALGDYRRQTEK